MPAGAPIMAGGGCRVGTAALQASPEGHKKRRAILHCEAQDL